MNSREAALDLLAHTGHDLLRHRSEPSRPPAPAAPVEAAAVVEFWREAGPDLWFAKDPEFDRRFRDRFLAWYEAAARGALTGWLASAEGALALVLLLDQFPRNAFRGTPRMYAADAMAREAATVAISAGHDRGVEKALQVFFYLPFAHSEQMSDQDRCVALVERLGGSDLSRARHHRDIVRCFGRFPHRNRILGRVSTAEEQRYLDGGGYAG